MNLSTLKSYKLWVAVAVAILGVLLSQGVIVEGSTISGIVGWVITLLGSAGAGAVAKGEQPPPA